MLFHEKFGWAFLTLVIISLATVIIFELTADKPTVRYSVSDGYSGLAIRVEIDNAADGFISCVGMTRNETLSFVDSLNAGLVKYPRLTK